jgi:hypothetical protein
MLRQISRPRMSPAMFRLSPPFFSGSIEHYAAIALFAMDVHDKRGLSLTNLSSLPTL